MKQLYITLLAACVLCCENLEYSPNQAFDSNSPRNLNAANLKKIDAEVNDDTTIIAFVGDSQRFYDDVDDFVDKANTYPNIDFVFLAGDITDFGLLSEYEWINTAFSRLNVPYLGVIGNHDVQGNGQEVFVRMFGPMNYSFVYDSIKFVVHNTNGREFIDRNVPDMAWLKNELQGEVPSGVKYFVGVSHVPPTDADFNADLVKPYSELLASTPGFLVSLHGHIHEHTDGYPFNDGVRYITSYAFNQRSFVILKFHAGNMWKELIEY